MKRNTIKKAVGIFLILVAFAVFWSFAAFSQTVKYNLLDAKLFPSPYAVEDQTAIAVLFTKEDGILYFGTYYHSETYGDAWTEEKVGNYDYKTGYATLATRTDDLSLGNSFIAFTTDDGAIMFWYRDSIGIWNTNTYIDSMNVGGNGSVYNPDIDIYFDNDRAEVYIAYMDTNGAEHENTYNHPDVMLAKIEPEPGSQNFYIKSVEKTVVEAGGETLLSDAQAAVKDGNINVVYNKKGTASQQGNTTPYFIRFFSGESTESLQTGRSTGEGYIPVLFDSCASGSNLFTLIHGSLDDGVNSGLFVLNGKEPVSKSYISNIGSGDVNAADITANLMQSGEFSYAAICLDDTLCYYDSAANNSIMTDLNTKIGSESKKVAVVETNKEADDARYVLYTGENGKIVVVRLSDSDVSDGIQSTKGREHFIPAEENTKYDLYVGGKRVNSDNASDVLEDGKVSYDAKTNTLYLNGATIERTAGNPDNHAVYYTGKEPLTIHAKGENTLKGGGSTLEYDGNYNYEAITAGIWSESSLSIELEDGAVLNAAGGSSVYYSSHGIYTSGDFAVSGKGTLNVSCGSDMGLDMGLEAIEKFYGINYAEKMTLSGETYVNISALYRVSYALVNDSYGGDFIIQAENWTGNMTLQAEYWTLFYHYNTEMFHDGILIDAYETTDSTTYTTLPDEPSDWTALSQNYKKLVFYPKSKEIVCTIGSTGYYSLTDALNAVNEDDMVITVLKDIEFDGARTVNGYDITIQSGENDVVITLTGAMKFGENNIMKTYTLQGNESANTTLTIQPKLTDGANSFRPIAIRKWNTLIVKSGAVLRGSNFTGGYGGMINVAQNATLNLNGGKIENCTAGYGGAVNIEKYGQFTFDSGSIENCSAIQGGAVYVAYLGKFLFNNGTITDCTAMHASEATREGSSVTAAGGAVYTVGLFTMYGGSINNCKAVSGKGGGVYVYPEGGDFCMSGGEISGCSATENENESLYYNDGEGGGVYVGKAAQGYLNMSVGDAGITGNTAKYGGGIYLHEGASMLVEKEAYIYGNTENNVYLAESVMFIVEKGIDKLTGNAKIGITTASKPTASGPVSFAKVSDDCKECFSDDSGNFCVSYDAESKVLNLNVQKASVTKKPTAKKLLRGDGPQILVTAGEASGGTMQYAVSDSDSSVPTEWSENIPERSDLGKYYVWYRAKGDETHLDSDAKYVISWILPKFSFRVVNGTWNDGTDGDITLPASYYSDEGSILITSEDHPAVGDKPANGFLNSGSWKFEFINEDTFLVYTYDEDP
ncbi:MAG: hypothetical protein J6036_06415, partial [Clostridia bacterium]|nr:hypothetical protein [Clostridia bacterium]